MLCGQVVGYCLVPVYLYRTVQLRHLGMMAISFQIYLQSMPVSARIIGSINVGSGLSYHTDYQLEVTVNDRKWIIFRRFSAFEDLHKKLLTELGGENKLSVKFPDKTSVGSYIGTLSVLTADRMSALQQYLDAIFIIEEAVDSKPLVDFLDCNHLGVSGILKELGSERVVKESFISTRISRNLPEVLGLWCMRFVVILSSGSLVVLTSVYDDSSKAIARMALVSGQTILTPQAGAGNVIVISSRLDKTKISLSFPSQADSVFWLRKLSDFVLNTDFSADHQKGVEQQKQQEAARVQQQRLLAAQHQEHIHAKGTGHTEDNLSSLLGI